ncbi:uracil-DNA glycosylase family protein [Variovorax sp. PBL-E5]|uniref:uracil-DNA glycosylase family protein n=1 Tax=Variovorax sp. PBL-E5 TaxID=434014 RepID=UPI0013195E1C|nr:uracil-DNA glycosylase family protein [Variovorax sp. PBL-E5]VTU39837.1 uracil-DNA glycosylase, family 4 [Variovorax sp. PBL-E5]
MTLHTLNLDARQRAMLDEMGVKVWWPMAQVAQPDQPAEVRPVAAAAAPPAPMAQVRARPAAAVPAGATPAARPAVAALHGAGILAEARRRLYGEEGAAQAGWLIVADMPPELDGRHGEPFAGDAGRLLGNMLRALQLHDGALPVHLMRTHRGVASGQPASPRPLAEVFAEAAAELAPRIVLAMGPLAAQSLMQSSEPLGKLRGRVAPLAVMTGMQDVPLVATYHPAYLLRNPADKARAWSDLCLAAEQLAR